MQLDQFPAYFKIEQLIVPPAQSRRKPTGFFAKWWKSSDSSSSKSPRLEPRFVAFEEGYIVIMNYMPELPTRDYGVFDEREDGSLKPLPELAWNAEITQAREIFDLDEVHLVNYKTVVNLEDPADNYLIIELIFSHYKIEPRPDNEALERKDEVMTFNIEFGDLEDFIAEVRF